MSPQWTFARRSGPGVWPAGQTPGPERQQRDGTFGFCCFDWEMAYRCLGAPFWSETLCHPTGPSPWLVSWIRFEKLVRSCFKQNYSEANDCRLCNSVRWMLTPDSKVGTEDWIIISCSLTVHALIQERLFGRIRAHSHLWHWRTWGPSWLLFLSPVISKLLAWTVFV